MKQATSGTSWTKHGLEGSKKRTIGMLGLLMEVLNQELGRGSNGLFRLLRAGLYVGGRAKDSMKGCKIWSNIGEMSTEERKLAWLGP